MVDQPPGRIRLGNREELITELRKLGFRTTDEEHSGRTILWAGGLRFGYIPARVSRPQDLATHYIAAVRFLQANGLPWRPQPTMPPPREPEPEPEPEYERRTYTDLDITELRMQATVESVGMRRSERVARWRLYREAFAERFGIYPPYEQNNQHGIRPILGRCPQCDQPEELSCLETCSSIDRLATQDPPTRPPRRPRPWNRMGPARQ